MLDTRYPFLSAYLKGEEAKFITSSEVNAMSSATSLQDILATIRETSIGNYLEGVLVENFADLDEHLWRYFGDCLERLEWLKPVPADILKILQTYLNKYDVFNIKAALQTIFSGKPARKIPVGMIYNQGLLDELSQAGSTDDVILLLNSCKLGGYATVLQEYDAEAGVAGKRRIEARLDAVYYNSLINITRGMKDGAIMAKVFGTQIDMKNLQIMLRAAISEAGPETAGYTISGGYMLSDNTIRELMSLKLPDIPARLENAAYRDLAEEIIASYDSTENITVIDELIEKYQFRLNRDILAPRVISPLMAAWYLILQENEIRNLRLILKAVFDNIPVEEIKSYLVLL